MVSSQVLPLRGFENTVNFAVVWKAPETRRQGRMVVVWNL
jgi:hypothetical protein